MLKRQLLPPLSVIAILLLFAFVASLLSACAPPAGMIATLTQLPLTPTRTRPTRVVTATLAPIGTPIPFNSSEETLTPGSLDPSQEEAGAENGATGGEPARGDLPTVQEESGRITVKGEVVFDAQRDAPGCRLNGISYSPTYEFFLVVPICADGINPGFLFRLDGSEREEITAQGNEIANGHYRWSPDGSRIVYLRKGAASTVRGSGAPPPALMIYHVSRGEKVMILDLSEDPELRDLTQLRWSPDGNWLAFLNIDPDLPITQIRLIHSDGTEQQVIDEFNENGSANRLSWQTTGGGNFQLDYHTPEGEVIRSYPISPAP